MYIHTPYVLWMRNALKNAPTYVHTVRSTYVYMRLQIHVHLHSTYIHTCSTCREQCSVQYSCTYSVRLTMDGHGCMDAWKEDMKACTTTSSAFLAPARTPIHPYFHTIFKGWMFHSNIIQIIIIVIRSILYTAYGVIISGSSLQPLASPTYKPSMPASK